MAIIPFAESKSPSLTLTAAAAAEKKCRRKLKIATSGETFSLFAVNRDPALSAIKDKMRTGLISSA